MKLFLFKFFFIAHQYSFLFIIPTFYHVFVLSELFIHLLCFLFLSNFSFKSLTKQTASSNSTSKGKSMLVHFIIHSKSSINLAILSSISIPSYLLMPIELLEP